LSAKVAIIIPSQGHDVGSFHQVARELAKSVYKDSVIVKANITGQGDNLTVNLTWNNHPFSLSNHKDLRRVLTISHGMLDGPNLAYGSDLPLDAHQPWASGGGELTEQGRDFWRSVSQNMRPDGKIIFLGCLMGAGNFARNVAGLTRKKVYASQSLFGAGDGKIAVSAVKAVEANSHQSALVSF
jgi:hypothetical protein